MVLRAHGHPIPLGRQTVPPSCTGLRTCSSCGPSFIPRSLGLPLHGSRANEHPPPGGHPGPGRRTPRKAAWVLPAGVGSPGTRGRKPPSPPPRACLGSFLVHRLEGALGLPAPSAHPVAVAVALPPIPHVSRGGGQDQEEAAQAQHHQSDAGSLAPRCLWGRCADGRPWPAKSLRPPRLRKSCPARLTSARRGCGRLAGGSPPGVRLGAERPLAGTSTHRLARPGTWPRSQSQLSGSQPPCQPARTLPTLTCSLTFPGATCGWEGV